MASKLHLALEGAVRRMTRSSLGEPVLITQPAAGEFEVQAIFNDSSTLQDVSPQIHATAMVTALDFEAEPRRVPQKDDLVTREGVVYAVASVPRRDDSIGKIVLELRRLRKAS